MAKLLVIKTAEAIIYIANGKVTLVKNALNGRFMKIAKFAKIVNNLIVAAKKANSAISQHKTFYFDNTTKLAMRNFKNLAKMATALLGEVLVHVSRNYRHTGFDFTLLAMYS